MKTSASIQKYNNYQNKAIHLIPTCFIKGCMRTSMKLVKYLRFSNNDVDQLKNKSQMLLVTQYKNIVDNNP